MIQTKAANIIFDNTIMKIVDYCIIIVYTILTSNDRNAYALLYK